MVVQMERGMPRRGKREVCPIRASYPKGLGEFTPLACRAVQGAALASLAVVDCQACMGVQRGTLRQGYQINASDLVYLVC